MRSLWGLFVKGMMVLDADLESVDSILTKVLQQCSAVMMTHSVPLAVGEWEGV